MSYHQMIANKCSHCKLAFAGSNTTLYTYSVIPFSPVNGPSIFMPTNFDLNSEWQAMARDLKVRINEDTNSKIIVDKFFTHAKTWDHAFAYMECQLIVTSQ